ncbi:hypothetical protein FQZ97_1083180 [compost metagenome]
MADRGGHVGKRDIRIHDRFIDAGRIGLVQPLVTRRLGDEIGQHQGRQRIDLAETEGLAGKERLEEHRAETVVRERLAADGLAAEFVVPDPLAAAPQ